jgi:hypothetical protein
LIFLIFFKKIEKEKGKKKKKRKKRKIRKRYWAGPIECLQRGGASIAPANEPEVGP